MCETVPSTFSMVSNRLVDERFSRFSVNGVLMGSRRAWNEHLFVIPRSAPLGLPAVFRCWHNSAEWLLQEHFHGTSSAPSEASSLTSQRRDSVRQGLVDALPRRSTELMILGAPFGKSGKFHLKSTLRVSSSAEFTQHVVHSWGPCTRSIDV